MLSQIFKDMKDIRDKGGIHMTLDFGENMRYGVIAIPVIYFIIGDCKGNDLQCGHNGGDSLLMNGQCRYCNIILSDGDNTCIGRELICSFRKTVNIIGKSKDELYQFSFLPITNDFINISFGGCDRGIYDATPT